MNSFNTRKYELFVEFVDNDFAKQAGQIVEAGSTLAPLTDFNPQQIQDIIRPSAKTLLVKDLSLKANLDFNRKKGNTTSTIEIINLSKESRDRIARKNNKVVLKAGYSKDESLSVILVGQVIWAETKRHGQDVITTLAVDDSFNIKTSPRITRSYPPRTYYSTVIDDLLQELRVAGYSRGNVVLHINVNGKLSPQANMAIGGVTVEGYVEDILKDMCINMFGLEYFVYNKRISILPPEWAVFSNTMIVDSSQIKSMAKSTGNNGGTTDSKFTLSTFLIGGIDESDKVQITEGDYEGDYRVISIKHKMDYLGRDWDTILELEAL